MKASILDLRYKMHDILQALSNGERVTITERGKERGTIIPSSEVEKPLVTKSSFFGMRKNDTENVAEVMNKIRRSRYDF
jgi:antitoxin (DNA-binding transcriptional repressor) of toxin-antitoxin stability system